MVVVPVHNERDRLPRCLSRLADAAFRVEVPVTVVVVLDACTDGSEEVLTSGIHAMTVTARCVGAARAAGFRAVAPRASASTWFATTDADSLVPETWLAKHAAHHRAMVDVAVGTVAVEWREHPLAVQQRYDDLYAAPHEDAHGHVHGANLGVRADAYWGAGGFRPLPVGEDVDLVDRLTACGASIAWDSHNPVLTSDRRDGRARGGFGDYVQALNAR